jgi:hypothetical protein
MLKLLTEANFFASSTDKEIVADSGGLTSEQIFVGTVLFQLLNICPCNSHDVGSFGIPAGSETFPPSSEKISLGAAIYPTLAMYNHSCNPDFMRCNRGTPSSASPTGTSKKVAIDTRL